MILTGWLVIKLAAQPMPTSVGFPTAIGIALSAWGVAISIGGFGVTWWQLERTETTSKAVTQALTRIKRDFSSFDVITEIRTARGYGEVTQDHIGRHRWDDALFSYNNLRISLTKIVAVQGGLRDGHREQARDFIAVALDACQAIERLRGKNADELSSEILNADLRKLDGFLIDVEYNLKDSMHGQQ